MRASIAALVLALASILVGGSPALADVPVHLHCLTTPGGTHSIARGLTANGPHDAFTRFHFQVHLGALTNPNNPVSVAATAPTGSC
ncbi:MAG TPA: hypothetical protein VJ726_00260 [Candidatus Limnocylindria bacterium]|nr:hypothetical protein [Candidatus Limnocylindria bacterium]